MKLAAWHGKVGSMDGVGGTQAETFHDRKNVCICLD